MLTVRCRGRLLPLFCQGGGSHYLPSLAPATTTTIWFSLCSYLNNKYPFLGKREKKVAPDPAILTSGHDICPLLIKGGHVIAVMATLSRKRSSSFQQIRHGPGGRLLGNVQGSWLGGRRWAGTAQGHGWGPAGAAPLGAGTPGKAWPRSCPRCSSGLLLPGGNTSFLHKKLRPFPNGKTGSLLLLLGRGLCGCERHDFWIFFSKRQAGKTTGVNNIVSQTPHGEAES